MSVCRGFAEGYGTVMLPELVCLELRGGIGGAFNNRHSSFTCNGGKTMITLSLHNYTVRVVNKHLPQMSEQRFLETGCSNLKLESPGNVTFVPTWKKILSGVIDQQCK